MNVRRKLPLLVMLLPGFFSGGYAQKVYVFYPALVRPHVIQNQLSAAFPGMTITVFGRYADFKANVDQDQPEAVLTKPDVIKQFSGYENKLFGVNDGAHNEPYILLSVDRPVDITSLEGEYIGVIDFLGRKGMENLIATCFPSIPKLKRVAKQEDLLPLINFNMVRAIFISKRQSVHLREKSQLPLVETPLSEVAIGTVALAVRRDAGRSQDEIVAIVRNFHDAINAFFEVERWK